MLIDRLGTRRGFLVIMVGWSLACAIPGLATSVWMLAGSRFLLGAGEGGGFPAATKVITEWFPVASARRPWGSSTPGLRSAPWWRRRIAAILTYSNWRWVFVACAAVGLLWAVWWASALPASDQAAAVVPASTSLKAGLTGTSAHVVEPSDLRQVWGLVGAGFLTDAAWFFYIAWLPKYL